MTATTKKPFGILGFIAAAACVACCAGPILGFIAATGVLTATSVALFGTIGLLSPSPPSSSSLGGGLDPRPAHPRTNRRAWR